MIKTLLILGAGGHGTVVADCALSNGSWTDITFLDDRYPEISSVNGWNVIGKVRDWSNFVDCFPEMALGIGVSHDSRRVDWVNMMSQSGVVFPPIIHPSAVISQFATIGDATVVFAGAVLNVNTHIGKGCIINTNATIDHDCFIGNGSHISPSACLAGNVNIGDVCWIGMGANVIQGVSIGSGSVVGAGALVLKDIPSGCKAFGSPAILIDS